MLGVFRATFSLRTLCLFVVVAGAALGWIGRSLVHSTMIVRKHGLVEWTDKDGKMQLVLLSARWWRRVGGKEQLIYLFIQPDGAPGYSVSPEYIRDEEANHVHLYNMGLAFEGRPITLGAGKRVWIHSKDRCLKPIPLSDSDERGITPDVFFQLHTTRLWVEKIEPVWKRERMRN